MNNDCDYVKQTQVARWLKVIPNIKVEEGEEMDISCTATDGNPLPKVEIITITITITITTTVTIKAIRGMNQQANLAPLIGKKIVKLN